MNSRLPNRHRAIADDLRAGIRHGTFPEGAALPSEHALAERYNVTRMTAHLAVGLLKAEGLVRSEQGRAAFVQRSTTPESDSDLRDALEALLEWVERFRGGDPQLDPEEWYRVRDFARDTLQRTAIS